MPLFGRDPRDTLIEALQQELTRAHEEKAALMAQVKDLVDKLSAHSDAKAHAAATREKQAAPKRPPVQPSTRLPPFIAGLSTGGHVNLKGIRRAVHSRRNPTSVSASMPAAVDVERHG